MLSDWMQNKNTRNMLEYERKAEKIIISAYKKGGKITIDDILREFNEDYIARTVMNILYNYGETEGSLILSESGILVKSPYDWSCLKLSEKGMEFARKGCFTGEERRELLTKAGIIAVIIATITGIISLFI